MIFRAMLLAAAMAVLAQTQFAVAQHGHGHAHDHGDAEPYVAPTTYRQAVEQIDDRMHRIAELMKTGELTKVHPQAEVIMNVGKLIGQLALKEGSGVPKEEVKAVNLAGKELAGKFEAIDRAGDSGDAPGTKKVYDEMVPLLATLRKHAPVLYVCPMRCEAEKTYPAEGKCPVCSMALQDTRAHQDHEAKHGGVFFMASDNWHHLEGTLSAEGEFRLYFYDDRTRDISAEPFTAEARAWAKGAAEGDRKPFTISPSPKKDYLVGRIDAGLRCPVSVKAYITFKKGDKPQVFDFDFEQPSPAPGSEPARGH